MENIKCYKVITTKEALVPLELTWPGLTVSQNSLSCMSPFGVATRDTLEGCLESWREAAATL